MENRAFWIVILVLVVGVAAVLLQPTVEEQLAPTLESAWVAIEVESSDLAEVGPVTLEPGQKFTLRAALGAKDRNGEPVYYTEAKRLRIAGAEVPSEQLRPWDRSKLIKVRWYTVEGRWPYLPLDNESGLRAFEFQEFLRADWPLAWTIPGDLDAANDDQFERSPHMPKQLFGTQRYQVRVELYDNVKNLVPERVIDSWGVEDLRQKIDEFPTVVVQEPGRLAPATRVFGLTELGLPEDPSTQLRAQIEELSSAGIAFTRLTLLRDLAASAGTTFAALPWHSIGLDGTVPWSGAAADGSVADGSVADGSAPNVVTAGDLIRVGDRVVVLYQDRGEPGFLDYGDLCLDFVQGADVRSLDEVFSGEGLEVDWASLAGGL